MQGWGIARRRSKLKRLNAAADPKFFNQFVRRYPDKQYQTWLGAHYTMVGVDYTYEKELQDRIFAGMANYFFGYSFTSAMKLTKDKPRSNEIPPFEQKFDSVELAFYSTSKAFLQAERPRDLLDGHELVKHAELFLLRLLTSLQAARRLINWGYLAEPLTILRSVLEQLSWTYAVGITLDQRQLDKPQPSKCIGAFRDRFAAAGHLYGALSRFSHMDFEGQKHFVAASDLHTGVMEQSTEFKFFGLIFYAYLLIAFQYVCRDLQEFYLKHYQRHYFLRNAVLPLRYLVGHALARPELREDEVANTLAQIYLDTFPLRIP